MPICAFENACVRVCVHVCAQASLALAVRARVHASMSKLARKPAFLRLPTTSQVMQYMQLGLTPTLKGLKGHP